MNLIARISIHHGSLIHNTVLSTRDGLEHLCYPTNVHFTLPATLAKELKEQNTQFDIQKQKWFQKTDAKIDISV